jgi:hypothetical protein
MVKLEDEQSGQRIRLKENISLLRKVEDKAMASRPRKASKLSAYDSVCLLHDGKLEGGGGYCCGCTLYNCVCVGVSTMVNSESATKKVVQWRPVLCYSSVLFALDWRRAAGQQKITKIPRLEPIINPAGRKPSLIYHVLRRNLVFTKKMEKVLKRLYILKGLPDENVLGVTI